MKTEDPGYEKQNSKLEALPLKKVSGGNTEVAGRTTYTDMFCESCHDGVVWIGNYMNGKYYTCSTCGKNTLHGIKSF